jgi:hypothetical protein
MGGNILMTEIIHKLVEALKSPNLPIILFTAFHASNHFIEKFEDDPTPGDNFPHINI